MEKTDIQVIPLTREMLLEAKEFAQYIQRDKTGTTERRVTNSQGKVVKHNFVGYLGHFAVDIAFERLGLATHSTRKERYHKVGDKYDIQYEEDFIDVKTHQAEFNEKWFFNERFLVFQTQLDDPKINDLTHFCFVTIDPDYRNARIYGVISLTDFYKCCEPVKLQYENQGVKAHRLTPFRNYALRSPKVRHMGYN